MTPTTSGTYKYSNLATTKFTCKAYQQKIISLSYLLRKKGGGLQLGDDLKLK